MKDLHTLLTDFEHVLSKTIETSWAKRDFSSYLKALVEGASNISEAVIKTGAFCQDQLQSIGEKGGQTSDVFSCQLVNFLWLDYAKSFLLLWRDVVFQTQKGLILYQENKLDKPGFSKLKSLSKKTIEAAAKDLTAYYELETERISKLRKGKQRQVAQWSLLQNPYPVYRSQLEMIARHCEQLLINYEESKQVSESLDEIRTHIQNTKGSFAAEINHVKTLAQKAITTLEPFFEEKPGKIPGLLEDLEAELGEPTSVKNLTTTLKEPLDGLNKKTQVPVNTSEGLIQYKEINFHRSARLWLESQIIPVLFEFWELKEEVTNGLKMAFLNIRNRAVLLANEEDRKAAAQKEDICQPLRIFLDKIRILESEATGFQELISGRLDKSFGLFSVYDLNQDFLPIPLQSTINRFKIRRNRWLAPLQHWWARLSGFVQRFRSSVKQEEVLSVSEKIVRFIQHRTAESENHHYSSIFLTKGYIGESFCIGREDELQHMGNLISQWQQGYRGAVILSGQRFSGKTLFGELVVGRHFYKKNIRLVPNTVIKLQGRQFTCRYDLGEALDFIRKHALQSQVVVWIDDLELWSDVNQPLSQNVRKLCRYIDNYSRQIFFMVSMSNWLKAYLDKTHDLSKKFQAEINMDRMSVEEIREAILIRHGATHKLLVDEEGEEISSKAFQKISTRIHRATEGNIGEALLYWSFSTRKYDEEKVAYTQGNPYAFPDFLNADAAILLAALMMEKRSNEYRLRKLFGVPFKEKYSSILQRLVSIGLLDRHLDGWLEVNEKVVNEMGKLLGRQQFLTFYHQK